MPGSPATRPAPELPAGPRLALVVATTTYSDPALRELRAPAQDMADLSHVLEDPQIGGFAVTAVIDAPVQQVRLAVEEFLSDRATEDLLLVYLSCHGLVDARRRLYFAASDTLKGRLAATGLEAQWVLDQLDDCRARRQVVILDCCFSGAFARGAKGEGDLGLGERFHGDGRGRVVLTASRASEYSFEGEPVPGAAMSGSVFTTSLLDGLRSGEADVDHDGLISVEDAYSYAFDRVQASGAQQTPQRWLYGGEGAIVLARSPAGIAVAPAPLPDAVRDALDSPHPWSRLGAVAALGEWLGDDDAGRVLAARQTLQHVADADVPRVAAAAADLLTGTANEPPVTDGSAVVGTSPAPRVEQPGGAPPPAATTLAAATVRRTPPGRRRAALIVAAVAALAAAASVVALTWNHGGGGLVGGRAVSCSPRTCSVDFTAQAPWRLVVHDARHGHDTGCAVTLRNQDTGTSDTFPTVSIERSFQVAGSGSFRASFNDPGCLVVQRAGPGSAALPFAARAYTGDTDAFAGGGAVSVAKRVGPDSGDSSCRVELLDVSTGGLVDFHTFNNGDPPWTFDLRGRSLVYIKDLTCDLRVSAG